MPVYFYRCDMLHCNKQFQVKLRMSEVLTDCPLCHTKGSLTRMPPPFTIKKPEVNLTGNPGDVMKETIVLTKEQIEDHKKEAASDRNVVTVKKDKK